VAVQISDDRTLYTLHFADDQVVIAQDKEGLEYMTRKLLNEYEEWGLSVNRFKTKYLCIGDDRDYLHPQENETISCYTEYTYLGTKINNGGRREKEIEDRIIKRKKVMVLQMYLSRKEAPLIPINIQKYSAVRM